MKSRSLMLSIPIFVVISGCSNGIGYVRDHDIGYYFCSRDRNLTTDALSDAYRWSPDGTKLAFTRRASVAGGQPENDLIVRDMATGAEREAVHHLYGDVHFSFDWSPDGTAIVFEHDVCATCNANISIVNLTDGSLRLMTPTTTNDMQPDWSTAGRRIAFVSRSAESGSDIYWMNSDGTGRWRLTQTTDDDIYPVWSPDADRIAFIRIQATTPRRYSVATIRRAELAGRITTLVSGYTEIGSLSWSPDGLKLLFHGRDAGDTRFSVYTVNADGTGLTNLSSLADPLYRRVEDSFPSWSPNGRQIAFTRSADFERDGINWHVQGVLFRMKADGTAQERLSDAQFAHTTQWRPRSLLCFHP